MYLGVPTSLGGRMWNSQCNFVCGMLIKNLKLIIVALETPGNILEICLNCYREY
jgi:hypothetical protein